MKILGIDPGTATIGWAVIEADGPKVSAVGYGHISTSKDDLPETRLQEIRDDLVAILKRYHPEEGAVEELFFFNNQKTAIAVSQARGVILLTLKDFGLRLSGYTPLEVKQALTNYGRAEKKQVQIMVKTILKLKEIPTPDDTADALAIAMCHASHQKFQKMTQV
ncbi:MAG: crossover junction endodeoxyribonuclease RuvC [Candidatus Moraniibacteriota bacterium]